MGHQIAKRYENGNCCQIIIYQACLEQEMSRRICSHKLTITKAFRIQVRPSLIFPFLKSKL